MTEYAKLILAEQSCHTIEIREKATGKEGVANSCPAIPGVFLILSPITERAARPSFTLTGEREPLSISLAKVQSRTLFARAASLTLTPMEIPVSEADWQTRKALILSRARAVNILQLTPTTPAMEVPARVIRLTLSIEETPLMAFSPLTLAFRMVVPLPEGS